MAGIVVLTLLVPGIAMLIYAAILLRVADRARKPPIPPA
jgi:hypothetical protein